MEKKKAEGNKENRRDFFRKSLAIGIGATAGFTLLSACKKESGPIGEKTKVLTTDGKLVEVDASALNEVTVIPTGDDARDGIPGRKFVMVVDLAKCKNARKCVTECQRGHDLAPDQEWINVHLIKENEHSDPYWFPKPCYHCDKPPCVKVCPVDATYKRHDGIVLVDNERCIGCKFCISACPYSARIFNWEEKESYDNSDKVYSPETGTPGQAGTIGKCDFCPDRSREGKLPYCATGCPMGAIYFGDANEDAVTNGTDTFRFKQLLKDRGTFRYREDLGTEPRVYYLPASERSFPWERGLENLDDEEKEMYLKSI